jgi:hypothetical protein
LFDAKAVGSASSVVAIVSFHRLRYPKRAQTATIETISSSE